MKFLPGVFIVCVLLSACSGAYTSPSTETGSATGTTLTTVLVSQSGVGLNVDGALQVGKSSQLTATARSATGGQDVTTLATWQTSNSAIATVSTAGLVTGISPGSATLTATYQGKSGSLNELVVP